jgi:hypothetical protein
LLLLLLADKPPLSALVARTLPPVAAEELLRVLEPLLRLSCWTVPEEREALPEELERVELPEDRTVPLLLRLSC